MTVYVTVFQRGEIVVIEDGGGKGRAGWRVGKLNRIGVVVGVVAGVVVGVLAAIVHLPINEKPLARLQAAAGS